MTDDTEPVPTIPLRFDAVTRTYHASAAYIRRMVAAAMGWPVPDDEQDACAEFTPVL